MIGQIILHYAPKAHPPLADKILEKLGEGKPANVEWGYKCRSTRRIDQ